MCGGVGISGSPRARRITSLRAAASACSRKYGPSLPPLICSVRFDSAERSGVWEAVTGRIVDDMLSLLSLRSDLRAKPRGVEATPGCLVQNEPMHVVAGSPEVLRVVQLDV